MFLVIVSGSVNFSPLISATSLNIVINEMMFDPEGDDAGNEWIELYNKNDTQNISGWTISNRTGEAVATLPNWDFPNGTYLVVHFGVGINDSDFFDGEGDYYTGVTVEVFNNTMGECALYTNSPSSLSITDFISWANGTYTGGTAHDFAVNAGIWDSGDFFDSIDSQGPPHMSPVIALPGDSAGRDASSSDLDQPEDWECYGGWDAGTATQGSANNVSWTFGPVVAPDPLPQPHKNWTFLVYLGGDLTSCVHERQIFKYIDEMEKVGSTDTVNIVTEVDFRNIDAGRTSRIYVTQDATGQVINSPRIIIDEINTGQPAPLTAFVNWALGNFSADKYALVLKTHGNGWKGLLIDESSNDDWLYMGELKDALGPVPRLLDIIGFDACLMATIEVGWQIWNDANYMVASEEVVPLECWPYRDILTGLTTNPYWDAETFSKNIVDYYAAFCSAKGYRRWTKSAVALGIDYADLVNMTSTFADDMLGKYSQHEWGLEDYDFRFRVHNDPNDNVQINVKNALLATQLYRDGNFKDLHNLMKNIDAAASIPPEYKAQAVPIMNKLVKGAGVIIEENHTLTHCRSRGLSIYFPRAQTKYTGGENPFDDPWPSCIANSSTSLATYAEDFTTEWGAVPYFGPAPHPLPQTPNFDFRDDTLWDEFLHRYYKPVADAGGDQIIVVGPEQWGAWVVLFGCGSSDSDGSIVRYIWDLDPFVNDDGGDWDKDLKPAEPDDDNDVEGHIIVLWLPIGKYKIKLTIWDDHNTANQTPTNYNKTTWVGHSNHWKTDQDHLWIIIGSTRGGGAGRWNLLR